MAFYADEGEVWKCTEHPSRRRRTGICPVCLKDRLASLCPDCGHARPCTCTTSSSSCSSSSSSSLGHFANSTAGDIAGPGSVRNLIETEPAFRRSRSLAIPFLRSKPEINITREKMDSNGKTKTSTAAFWSVFKAGNKSRRSGGDGGEAERRTRERIAEEERSRMMRRSRSVAVAITSDLGKAEVVRSSPSSSRWKSWYFPSPIKAFRQSKVSKILVTERSPLQRG